VIKRWVAGGCMTLLCAATAVASPQEVLSFGKGRPVPSGDVARGQNIVNAVCWACHGRDLNGASAPPLTGSVFFKEWRGRPADELSDFIRNKMPKDEPGALSEQGAHNVVAYIVAFANKRKSLAGEQAAK
jgi:mono/diheme cytochrome c family protein